MTEQKTKPVVNVKGITQDRERVILKSNPVTVEFFERPSSDPIKFGTKILKKMTWKNGNISTRLAGIAYTEKEKIDMLDRLRKEERKK